MAYSTDTVIPLSILAEVELAAESRFRAAE